MITTGPTRISPGFRLIQKITSLRKYADIPVQPDTTMSSKVLSISLRPQKLDEVIGLDDIVESVKTQFKSGRVPHFFLITGDSGVGKSTLARIIAVMLQYQDHTKIDYAVPLSKYDITEINASDKNGVDDVRALLDIVYYKPLAPSLAKVFILDESHQLTSPAQNALLKVLEDSPPQTYFIFCTNTPTKLLPTIKRRAFTLHLYGLDQPATHQLLSIAKKKVDFKGDTKELENTLVENDVNSPGLILQAAEKYFNGADINSCIFSGADSKIDTKTLCNLVSKGNFKGASPLLKTLTKEDVVFVRVCILGYLKAILLSSGSVSIAKAMKVIAEDCYDLPTFLANVCIACDLLKNKAA